MGLGVSYSKIFRVASIAVIAVIMQSCGIYSQSGVNVGTAKTVSVDYIPNKAPLVSLRLSQVFSEKLKDKVSREAPLTLVQEDGDTQFSGEITDYNIAPVALSGNSGSATNRLTIRVKISFKNKTDEKFNFDQEFYGFADFDANANFTVLEGELINTVVSQIVQDIFSKAFNNW